MAVDGLFFVGPNVLISSRPSLWTTMACRTPNRHSVSAIGRMSDSSGTPMTCVAQPGWPTAQDVKDGSERQFPPNGLHVPHRRMKLRGEHEADAGLADTFGDAIRPGIHVDPQSHQNIRRAAHAGDAAVAVLGDAGARPRRNDGRGRRDIERLEPGSARPAGVIRPSAPQSTRTA